MSGLTLVVAVLLIAVNGFFVALEFAALGAKRSVIDDRAEAGNRAAIAARSLQASLPATLGASQLGITVSSLVLGKIAEPAVADLLDEAFDVLGLSQNLRHTLAFAVALTLVAFTQMLWGEMVPKNVAIAKAETSLLLMAVPMRAFAWLVAPLNKLLLALANIVLRLLRVKLRHELDGAATSAELLAMVRQSAEGGLIDEDDLNLLGAAVAFGELTARNVMVPMSEVDAVSISASAAEVEHQLIATNHARLVVYEDTLANVRGFVHGKDLLRLSPAAREAPLGQRVVRPMVRIPVDSALPDVLLAMQRTSILLGLVVDGSAAVGVVTLDNVLNELVSPAAT